MPLDIVPSVCPHDCPSACALEVERKDRNTIGRIRGAAGNDYTAGVICAKVARYAERVHHPDRLMRPLLRTGPKGSTQFREISWDEALDRVADGFRRTARSRSRSVRRSRRARSLKMLLLAMRRTPSGADHTEFAAAGVR